MWALIATSRTNSGDVGIRGLGDILGSFSYMDLCVQPASALLHTIYFLHEGSMYAKCCVP